VSLAAVKGDRTLAQPAVHFDVHPNQVASWKAQLEGGAADVFWSRQGSGLCESPAHLRHSTEPLACSLTGRRSLARSGHSGALIGSFRGTHWTGELVLELAILCG